MVNVLSGKDWIPKWEAKVVMATVTKAQTLNSNKALILCIAGGKHCDAEMVRQHPERYCHHCTAILVRSKGSYHQVNTSQSSLAA